MSEVKYEIQPIMFAVSQTQEVDTDCMTITFRNQGTEDAFIQPDSSQGGKLKLEQGQERTYGILDPSIKYTGKFKVTFGAVGGTKELLVEKEQAKYVGSCEVL